MSSQDDPEERIRELERSLGDQTAELTQSSAETRPGPYVGPYVDASPPPPPPQYPGPPAHVPPPSYGGPFSTVPMSSPRRVSKAPLLFGVIAMFAIGIIVGAVFFVSNVFSSVSSLIPSGSPTISGGGGTFGDRPSRSGANRPQITIAAPTVSNGPPGGDISVSGVGEDKTIECNGGVVSVSGVSNTVVLTGHCGSVTISGIENVVTIDESDAISASGLNNRVTYHSGTPDIQNSGSSNVVERG